MLNRPGFKTSEFLIGLLNGVVQVALALNGTETNGTATQLTVAGAIAFIISRGLAKYEPRQTVTHVVTTTAIAPPPPPA